jgi:hypothetical protein
MAFQGWEKIPSEDLYNLAKRRGLSKAAVKKALKELGYPRKRKGQRWGSQWYHRNTDSDWNEQLRAIHEGEFRAATDAEMKEDSIPWKLTKDQMDYYEL